MSDTDGAPPQARKPLLIGLGVLLVVALGYLLIALTNQDDGVSDIDQTQAVIGSEPTGVGTEPGLAGPDATSEPDSSEEPSEGGADTPAFEVFDARDPFDQLAADDTGAVGATDDTAATTPAADTDDTAATTPAADTVDDVVTPVDGAPAGSGGPSQTAVDATTIGLEDVFEEDGHDMVIVQVGNEGYEAAEGDTVAGDLTVLDIADSCATMRFGDTRFILCEGEQIRK